MKSYEVEVIRNFTIKVEDHVIDRVIENWDDTNTPQPRQKGGRGWLDHLYNLDEEEAIQMLVYNIGMRDIGLSRLDGWADCEDEDVQIEEDYPSYYTRRLDGTN
jgi:hypothetical protein